MRRFVSAGLALCLLVSAKAAAQPGPVFANPPEVTGKDGKLRAVVEMRSGMYEIPNVGAMALRQFRGWDPRTSTSPPTDDRISPGPTLRARLGDRVEIAFINKVDDKSFAYSSVHDPRPGLSGHGCDKVLAGTVAREGDKVPYTGYPGRDKFPNCFHGSSTGNLHFHGTHSSPEGLADNVLVQVLPYSQKGDDWAKVFEREIFAKPAIPSSWSALPANYRKWQDAQIKKISADLFAKNQQEIKAGKWPEFVLGAFPNVYVIPDYDSGKYVAGQAPGTHWYHAHKHGSTSLHILNGLAGAFVIESSREGGYDHFIRRFYGWGDKYGEHEKILVFQQYDPTQNLERPGTRGKGIKQVLVNGRFKPTLTMRPGEVQLWRLINGTEGNFLGNVQNDFFQTAGFEYRQTAQDGVQFSPRNYKDQPYSTGAAAATPAKPPLTLAGGNRADLLVRAPAKPGTYAFSSGKVVLLNVTVAGDEVKLDRAFPADWPDPPKFLADLAAPGPDSIKNPNATPLRFQWEDGRTARGLDKDGFPPRFMINNKQFGETGAVVDQCMPLGETQDWVIENHTTVMHPFHIHTNPFQVLKVETPGAGGGTYTPAGDRVWHDVFGLPPGVIAADGKTITPSRVTIRHKFADFTGTFVLHCHILAHEDRGMMQLVRVVPLAHYPGACQGSIPHHH